MELDGAFLHAQHLPHLLVREPLFREFQNLALAKSRNVQVVAAKAATQGGVRNVSLERLILHPNPAFAYGIDSLSQHSEYLIVSHDAANAQSEHPNHVCISLLAIDHQKFAVWKIAAKPAQAPPQRRHQTAIIENEDRTRNAGKGFYDIVEGHGRNVRRFFSEQAHDILGGKKVAPYKIEADAGIAIYSGVRCNRKVCNAPHGLTPEPPTYRRLFMGCRQKGTTFVQS